MNAETNTLLASAAAELKAAGAGEVFVFGSAAKGPLGPDSDLDIAVSGLSPAVFYRVGARLDGLLGGRTVDLIDLDVSTPFTRYLREQHELIRVG